MSLREGQTKRRFQEDTESIDAQPPKKKRRTSKDKSKKSRKRSSKRQSKSKSTTPKEEETKQEETASPATTPATETNNSSPATGSKKKRRPTAKPQDRRLKYKKSKSATTDVSERVYNKRGLEVFPDLRRMIVARPPPDVKPPKYQFEIRQHVLAWYGKYLQWEAVVMGRMADWNPARENYDYEYRLHYVGWNESWDAWKSAIEIEELTPEAKRAASEKRKEARKLDKRGKSLESSSEEAEEDEEYDARNDPKATSLAKRHADLWLIDSKLRQLNLSTVEPRIRASCRLASEKCQISPLPVGKPYRVIDICESFLKSKQITSRNDADRRQYYQLVSNMLRLFDRIAFTRCLVEVEEAYVLQRHFETRLEAKRLLGIEHFLRFFCEFGGVMCKVKLDHTRRSQIMKKANSFVTFVKRGKKFWPADSEYENISDIWDGKEYVLLNDDGSERRM